ncbi:GAF domain-containing protein [Pontibacter aydingkolensis]|uniref:GAF domain-containing protein n=1 Tax=Pontibacter aydingkolensis TaxID=1911536 RepID=A0ABS7CRB3_9BACT|nr:GAF domain-containing protein [Pontibacter aydingkolensis]MBW7466360.1 GAF domain-containing protein [Pontibacter aydingkolensis]
MVIEEERISALHRYQILDTPPDGSFDRITALAAKMFNMPIALITLVDHDRIWFKSKSGLEGVTQIDRVPGLCASAIFSKEVYLVENAIEDPRTLTNPLVCGEFGLRFYAAAPLHTHNGYNLGTLCIIDKNQRYINREQMEMLQELAGIVMDEMELRLSARNAISESKERITQLEEEIKILKSNQSA